MPRRDVCEQALVWSSLFFAASLAMLFGCAVWNKWGY